LGTGAAVEAGAVPRRLGAFDEPAERRLASADTRFWMVMAFALAAGAAIRFAYLFHGAPVRVLGDGFDYHLKALRLADGLGYTSALGRGGAEAAQHPPAWVTLLAGVAEAGGRSMRAHQITGLMVGLGVILMAGLVGRRFAGRRVGVVAALLAAAYPGFWVLDVQILSEPLGLLVAGVLMIVLADLWQRPSLGRAVLAGAIAGVLALVRSEQLALLVIAVAPLLLLNRRISPSRRLGWTVAATLAAAVLIAPWTVHNLGRFEEPVLLSTNLGNTLIGGNCPATYDGELIGGYDRECSDRVGLPPGLDRSERDVELRKTAFENMRDNIDRLPATVLARYGRTLGVFRPGQTVERAASWLGSDSWPIWAWVTSFWLIAPLAVYGGLQLRRSRTFQWPLVAPAAIVLLVVTVAAGDLRYHTPGDLGLIVLAAVAVDRLIPRRSRSAGAKSLVAGGVASNSGDEVDAAFPGCRGEKSNILGTRRPGLGAAPQPPGWVLPVATSSGRTAGPSSLTALDPAESELNRRQRSFRILDPRTRR
jgi:Dolichyl-phosphate-mannose-protein mannosyltransferase